jgi:signal transduction histidine kinase
LSGRTFYSPGQAWVSFLAGGATAPDGPTEKGTLKKKNYLLFFYLPFLILILIFSFLYYLNRRYITRQVEAVVYEQLRATAGILKKDINRLLHEGYPLEDVFKFYSGEENIYFIAVLDEQKKILGWSSRFEGYLPLSSRDLQPERSWVIESPLGKIYNYFTPFPADDEGAGKYLYLGYSLQNLENLLAQSRRNFWIILGVFLLFGLMMSMGFFVLQRRFWAKEQEVLQTRAEMERYREISAFTSGVAHEIKNPLNSLALLFEILRKKVPSELQSKVSLGQAEVQRISRVIDEFSRLLKPLRLQREKIELRDFIARVVQEYRALAEEQKVMIKENVPARIYFQADPLLLAQAVGNILKNAIEASFGGQVVVKGQKQGDKILISIIDSGKGLSDEEAARIFEPFFTTKKEGLGIGLYLARKIVEAHGGRIKARFRKEGGTIFKVELGG